MGSETKSVLWLENYVHNKGIFLFLESPKESIRQIQTSYARYRGISLTPDEIETLYNLLCRVDRKMLRPLYAILIVDAYADDKSKPLNWNRKDALEYICEKEKKLLEESIKSLFGYYQDYGRIVDIAILLKVISTMVSGIDMRKDLGVILPTEKNFLDNLSPMQRHLFYSMEELFSEEGEFCFPLEPDIIGEYFVIKYFRENQHMRYYIGEAWKLPKRMKIFVSRVQQDHPSDFRFLSTFFQCITVTTPIIDKFGFEFSDNITKVTISDSVERIESCAFRGCRGLSRIEIRGNLSIGNSCFSNCQSLSEIMVRGKILDIGANAFSQCKSITEIKIRNNVSMIGESAFKECTNLERIFIGGDIGKICRDAFFRCKKLTDIYVDGSINYIDEYAFRGCKNVFFHMKGRVSKCHPKAFVNCRHYRLF